jgi:hypothetical protein
VALLQHRVQARVDITALRCLPGRGATGCRLA